MVNKVTITDSVLEDVDILHPLLRLEDVREIRATGSLPKEALLNGFIYSNECFTVKVNDEVAGMFGYTNYNQPKDTATIWFLGSDKMNTIPREWIVLGRKYIEDFNSKYKVLCGMIDQRQYSHKKWLEALGFTFGKSLYINRYKFIQFYKIKE